MDDINKLIELRAFDANMSFGFFKYSLEKHLVKKYDITKTAFSLKLAKLDPKGKVALAKTTKDSGIPGNSIMKNIMKFFIKDNED